MWGSLRCNTFIIDKGFREIEFQKLKSRLPLTPVDQHLECSISL
jgi:hypothetical protein